MSPIWFTPFIIVASALQAFGDVMSAQLRVSLTNPWLALTVLFTLNAFFFAGLFAVLPRPLPTIDGISAMPWWAPLAGLTGAVAVFAGLALIDKIGAGPVNGLIIMANLLTSLAIDHFGLMNMPYAQRRGTTDVSICKSVSSLLWSAIGFRGTYRGKILLSTHRLSMKTRPQSVTKPRLPRHTTSSTGLSQPTSPNTIR